MTWDRTCTVACSQGTRRPFIQIVSAFVKAILISRRKRVLVQVSSEYRAGGETISRCPLRPPAPSAGPAQDQGRPGAGAPPVDESKPKPASRSQEVGLVVHQDSGKDDAPAGREGGGQCRKDPVDGRGPRALRARHPCRNPGGRRDRPLASGSPA